MQGKTLMIGSKFRQAYAHLWRDQHRMLQADVQRDGVLVPLGPERLPPGVAMNQPAPVLPQVVRRQHPQRGRLCC